MDLEKTAILYWLRLPNHKNMFLQGYVGVTLDMTKRLRSHKHKFKNLWHAIIVEQLVVSTQNICFELEKKLRPERNIGWNKAQGGYRNNVMYKEQNPNFGKFGKDAPNFKGFFITPLGVFDSCKEAAKKHNVDAGTILRRCRGRIARNKFYSPKAGYAFEQKVEG